MAAQLPQSMDLTRTTIVGFNSFVQIERRLKAEAAGTIVPHQGNMVEESQIPAIAAIFIGNPLVDNWASHLLSATGRAEVARICPVIAQWGEKEIAVIQQLIGAPLAEFAKALVIHPGVSFYKDMMIETEQYIAKSRQAFDTPFHHGLDQVYKWMTDTLVTCRNQHAQSLAISQLVEYVQVQCTAMNKQLQPVAIAYIVAGMAKEICARCSSLWS